MKRLGIVRRVAAVAALVLTSQAYQVGSQAVEIGETALRADARVLAAHLGITEDDAFGQLLRQDAVAELEAAAQQRWPDSFAGLWIDPTDGGRVGIAFTEGAGAKVAALAREFAEPGLLYPVNQARTWSELNGTLARMVADRDEAHAGRLAFPDVAGGSYDLDVDVRRNAPVVIVENATPRLAAAFQSRYGTHVVVREGRVAVPEVCTQSDCRSSLRSGLSQSGCTTAFSVSTGGVRGILSAAHCSGTSRFHGGLQYGSVVTEQQSGAVDAERQSVSLNGFYAGAWIWVTSGTVNRPVTSVGTYAGLAIGASVCKTGITTQQTCGTVSSKTYSPSYVPGGVNFIQTTYCGQPGDSGSGVYIGNQAVGVHSGGTSGPCTTPGDFSLFGHIDFADAALGTTVVTSEPTPSFSSISGLSNLGTTIVLNFSKPVLCSSVQTADFTATMSGTALTVAAATCTADSDRTVELTVSPPLVATTTVSVTIPSGRVVEDAGLADVPTPSTRSATVPL